MVCHDAAVSQTQHAITGLTTPATAQADEAARTASHARLAAVTASREAARATMTLRTAENLKVRAEAQVVPPD
jgi:hypothetical protein